MEADTPPVGTPKTGVSQHRERQTARQGAVPPSPGVRTGKCAGRTLALLLALSACARPETAVMGAGGAGGGAATIERLADGTCRATDKSPAVIESRVRHELVRPAERGPGGEVLRPAEYRTIRVQRVAAPRREITFAAVCPEVLTPEFVAALQRALAVRGHYRGPVTGRLDTATRQAIRSYQQDHGLDSAILATRTARDLGLILWTAAAGEDAGR